MFRPKLIWAELDSRQSAAGQRFLPAPELPQARRFGAQRDRFYPRFRTAVSI